MSTAPNHNLFRHSPLAHAVTAFGTAAYKNMAANHPGQNLVFAPLATAYALELARSGAAGKTEEQLAQALHSRDSANVVTGKDYDQYAADLTRADAPFKAGVAARVYADQRFALAPDYAGSLSQLLGAKAGNLDFVTNTEGARQTINGDVAQATAGLVPELFAPGSLDALTRMVLTATTYVQGKWAKPFNPQFTVQSAFHLVSGEDVEANMMTSLRPAAFVKDGNVQILELDLNGDLGMVFVLPDKGVALSNVEASLTPERLESWFKSLSQASTNPSLENVMIAVPKFAIGSKSSMWDILEAMGVTDAFGAEADFTPMSSQYPKGELHIGNVFQGGKIKIDEVGVEAAGAAGVEMRARSMARNSFIADRPFLAILRDKRGIPLFIARVADPSLTP